MSYSKVEIIKQILKGDYDFSIKNFVRFRLINELQTILISEPNNKFVKMLLLFAVISDTFYSNDSEIIIETCIGNLNKHINFMSNYLKMSEIIINQNVDMGFQIKDVERRKNIISVSKDSILDINFDFSNSILHIYIKGTDIDYSFSYLG